MKKKKTGKFIKLFKKKGVKVRAIYIRWVVATKLRGNWKDSIRKICQQGISE